MCVGWAALPHGGGGDGGIKAHGPEHTLSRKEQMQMDVPFKGRANLP